MASQIGNLRLTVEIWFPNKAEFCYVPTFPAHPLAVETIYFIMSAYLCKAKVI